MLDDPDSFVRLAVTHFVQRDAAMAGRTNWRPRRLTPFTPGTWDHDDWSRWIDGGAQVDLTELVAVAGEPPYEFVVVAQTSVARSFDLHLVCLADPVPADSTVFTTEAAAFFAAVVPEGSLSGFLGELLTGPQFVERVWRQIGCIGGVG